MKTARRVLANDMSKQGARLPPERQAIRAKCFHPSGTFEEFPKEEIEQSIPEWFEKIVRMYPDYLAVKMEHRALTCGAPNKAANRVAHAILARHGQAIEAMALLFDLNSGAIVAISAVLKTRKVCVALDPSFPRARNDDILKDSQANLILTNNGRQALAYELTRVVHAHRNVIHSVIL